MRLFGIIGKTLVHSYSGKFFNEKFKKEGLSDCRHQLFEIPSIEHIHTMLEENPDLCGFNVTIPYKQQIIPLLDTISWEAEQIGAVNCVSVIDGKLHGYNTDIHGLRVSMDKLLNGGDIEKALVLGTGGASQAVQFMLAQMGIEYELLSRDPFKGSMTYDQLSPECFVDHKLIINTTPLGTYPNVDEAATLPYAFLSPDHYLFDLVYNPPVTQFLSYGEQRLSHTLNGETMFIAQAEESWKIWNNKNETM